MSELPAGRELDALIAEKVMGLSPVEWVGDSLLYGDQDTGGRVPHYSTDIRAALQVLEHMSPAKRVGQAYLPCITLNAPVAEGQWPDDVPLGRWSVEWFDGVQTLSCEDAETAPLAICRAALKAVGI